MGKGHNHRRSNHGQTRENKSFKKAIIQYKEPKLNETWISQKFKYDNGETVKEYIMTHADGDEKSCQTQLCKRIMELGECYDMFTVKSKALVQLLFWACKSCQNKRMKDPRGIEQLGKHGDSCSCSLDGAVIPLERMLPSSKFKLLRTKWLIRPQWHMHKERRGFFEWTKTLCS